MTLAFNTVGWAPQNILFNTLDTLLGDPTVADAFGNEEGAGARAYLRDSTVEAKAIDVAAINAGRLNRRWPTPPHPPPKPGSARLASPLVA